MRHCLLGETRRWSVGDVEEGRREMRKGRNLAVELMAN
jgi:hypothetical protein